MVPDPIGVDALRRVLVVKLRHHGDVLLSSPVFSLLKARAPQAEIDALVYDDTRDMLTGHPAIAQVHGIDRAWKRQGLLTQARREWAMLGALRARRYQLVVLLTDHRRGMWLPALLRPTWTVAPAVDDFWWRHLHTHTYRLPRHTHRHTVEANLDALRRVGLYPTEEDKRVVMVPGEAAEARVESLLASQGLAPKGFIHVHPTSRWLFKAWREESSAQMLRRLSEEGHRIVVTAAPDAREKAIVGRILAQAGVDVVDLSGALSLRELAALAARARLFVGVDSAPMHIAAAMGTPVVALFGPSDERVWGPWRVPHRVVAGAQPCRPCGNDGCGGGKVSECLTTLPVERVLPAAQELLHAS
jgi:heptosyltransferase-3